MIFQVVYDSVQILLLDLESFSWNADIVRLVSNPEMTRLNPEIEMPEGLSQTAIWYREAGWLPTR